ncbi:MAG: hypothetical protein OEY24_07020 [Candidatus Bathyarchaeota archaeon]|nr:hypothetical protein [Candidatus Bathyarchaeota archaeon]
MSADTKSHRMGAYIYGFVSGVGLILIIWGLASIAMLPSRYLMINIGLTLFGVALFACGSCREAYLRGNLSVPLKVYKHTQRNQHETANLISEQIIENPEEVESQKTHAS